MLAGEQVGDKRRPSENEPEHVISGGRIRDFVVGTYGNLRRPAITIRGVVIEGDIDLAYLEWRGDLDLRYCRINGALKINHMVLHGRLQLDGVEVTRVEAEYAVVDGPFLFREGLCRSGFPALGIHISGSLNLRKTELRAPEDKPNSAALGLFRAHIGDIFLTESRLEGGPVRKRRHDR